MSRSIFFVSGQYGEPIIADYKEYIPPPPLEDVKKSPFMIKGDSSKEDDEDEQGSGESIENDAKSTTDEGSC